MSSSSSAGGSSTIYIILGILILLITRRIFRVIRGQKVSVGRTIAFSVYYFGFAAILIAASYTAGGVSVTDLVLYGLIGAVGVWASYVFSNRRIAFWKTSDGSIYYKGAIIIYMIYLVALITRIGIDLAFIGPQAFSFNFGAPSAALSSTEIDAGIATDVLLSLGAGLLIGRNVRVLKRYNLIMAGKEEVPDSPPSVAMI
jgi:hypothetical protein